MVPVINVKGCIRVASLGAWFQYILAHIAAYALHATAVHAICLPFLLRMPPGARLLGPWSWVARPQEWPLQVSSWEAEGAAYMNNYLCFTMVVNVYVLLIIFRSWYF